MKVLVLGNQARSMCNFWTVLMRELKGLGHEVLCVVPEGETDYMVDLAHTAHEVRTYFLARKGLNPLQDCKTALDLARIFREERPDVLFATTIKPVIYGCLAAKWVKVPHIYATITGLGYTFEKDSVAKKLLNRLTTFLYRRALMGIEGIFFQNVDDRKVFETAGILDQNLRVCMARGTGVDTEHFAKAPLPNGELTILFVGRVLVAKGLRELAKAASMVHERYPAVRFQILGPLEKGLGGISKTELEAWESQGLIRYLGETKDVLSFLQAAHIVVLPSWREGIPTSIMEAMSVGRACIVTDVPGCREVVENGVNGYVVAPKDPSALAQAVFAFVEEPMRIAQMGNAARKRAEALFDAHVVARGIIQNMGLRSDVSASQERF